MVIKTKAYLSSHFAHVVVVKSHKATLEIFSPLSLIFL